MSFSSITWVISTGRRLSLVPSHGILISAEDEDHHLSFMRVEDEYYVEIAQRSGTTVGRSKSCIRKGVPRRGLRFAG